MLLLLSAAKFALVAMFYMHLKQDSKLFTGVFVFPLIIAAYHHRSDAVDGLSLGVRPVGLMSYAMRYWPGIGSMPMPIAHSR